MKKLLVINFFPAFSPPSSGGELRYFNLYNGLSDSFDITLLSPTFPQRRFEVITHSISFREYRIPKENIHIRLHSELESEGLSWEISALVCALSSFYPNAFHYYFNKLYSQSDIIIHESPFMLGYDLFWGADDKLRIYNSHNFETKLTEQIYEGPNAKKYIDYISSLERRLVLDSDLVFAVSSEERDGFIQYFGVSPNKIVQAPNGIHPDQLNVARSDDSDKKTALFIGSNHPPNLEAVDFIFRFLAPQCREIDFIIAGDCSRLNRHLLSSNIRLMGPVDAATKIRLFQTATIAVNPMFKGMGTNLKALEYLSAGIPLISTSIGARGLMIEDGIHYIKASKEDFLEKLKALVADSSVRKRISREGKVFINSRFNWKDILFSVKKCINDLAPKKHSNKLLLLNSFSAEKPDSGGEVRINRLYSNVSKHFPVFSICLNNENIIRRTPIADHYIELSLPKNKTHMAEESRFDAEIHIGTSDILTSMHCSKNELLTSVLRNSTTFTDAVVLSHPYMADLLDFCATKPVIYESHNNELLLKQDILKTHPFNHQLIKQVEAVENKAFRRSRLITCVSEKDRNDFIKQYGDASKNILLIPNGVEIKDRIFHEKVKQCFLGHPMILFVGSGHAPNLDAAYFITDSLAVELPFCYFLIIGSVCEMICKKTPSNVVLFGKLNSLYKDVLIRICDIAINPIQIGSGSSLKLAEYFINHIPVITTEIGKRGYQITSNREAIICDRSDFSKNIQKLLADKSLSAQIALKGHHHAIRYLDWRLISDQYRQVINDHIFPGSGLNKPKKLLVVTHRFTIPPLGGAEAHLYHLILELAKIGDFEIDIAALNVSNLRNQFHFAVEYFPCQADHLTYAIKSIRVLKFDLDPITVSEKFFKAGLLWKQWLTESRYISKKFVSRYTFPLLMGGWYFTEKILNHYEIWSCDCAELFLKNAKSVYLNGFSPSIKELSIFSDSGTLLYRNKVSGNFKLTLNTLGSNWLRLSTTTEIPDPSDPRNLGVKITSIRLDFGNSFQILPLDYSYRDFLKENFFSAYLEELINIAENRNPQFDDFFQMIRGPVSQELEEWLDRNISKYHLVLGHCVPFRTPLTAARYSQKYAIPFVLFPHFHFDDDFYHWKSYYDVARSARLVFASPESSIGSFYRPMGINAVYSPPGVDPKELQNIDSFSFKALYRRKYPFVLVLGRKSGSKNYRWIIHSMKQINRLNKICELVIIGPDNDGVPIEQSEAIYLGEQPRPVVLGALKECACLINMSESESFGMVLLEAWMFKKPVIANIRCQAFCELVKHNEDGLLCDRLGLPDAVERLLTDKQACERMGLNGFLKVMERYCWEGIGGAVNSALNDSLESHFEPAFIGSRHV